MQLTGLLCAPLRHYELRRRQALSDRLVAVDPDYAAVAGRRNVREFAEAHRRFHDAYPDFDTAWFRRARWTVERAAAAGPRLATWIRRDLLGRPSSSTWWRILHTSTATETHWQCPDCDAAGRCLETGPHGCTAGLVDIAGLSAGQQVTCRYCGRRTRPTG